MPVPVATFSLDTLPDDGVFIFLWTVSSLYVIGCFLRFFLHVKSGHVNFPVLGR